MGFLLAYFLVSSIWSTVGSYVCFKTVEVDLIDPNRFLPEFHVKLYQTSTV